MVTLHSHTCDRCKRITAVTFATEPDKAWRTVVLNRWKKLCPSCFDAEAEKAGVRYSFASPEGTSWSNQPPPRNPHKRRR